MFLNMDVYARGYRSGPAAMFPDLQDRAGTGPMSS